MHWWADKVSPRFVEAKGVEPGRVTRSRSRSTLENPTLRDVIDLLADQDESLLAELGHLDPKHFKKLVDHLEVSCHAGAAGVPPGRCIP